MSSRAAAPAKAASERRELRAKVAPGEAGRRARALLDAYRHGKLLEAVAIAAKELLRSSDLHVSLPKVCEQIGQATGVDCAHIILIDRAAGEGHILRHHVWGVSDLAMPPEFTQVKAAMADIGLKSWIPRFQRGETIVGQVHELEPEVRAFFERAGVQSVLRVPAFAEGQWLGIIGFDDFHGERDWSAAEIDTVKTLAELVGAAVARTTRLQTLADANRIVENSPTILYRLSPRPPFPLTFVSQNIKRYGYDIGEILATPIRWQQFVKREDMPPIIANLNAVAEGKAESIRAEFRFKKRDGSWAWFEDNGRALCDADGRLVAIEGILADITERKSAAHRRDVILEAVAASAKELLRTSDLRQSLPKVIERIGQATGVDRAHIFEVDASTPAARVLQHHMWSAPGVPTAPLLAAVEGVAMADVGFASWLPRLAEGETIVGHVRDFDKPVRNLFNQLGTQSVLTVPIRVDGQWRGQLGFDDCRTDREWSPTEVGTLETLAELVGAAVARTARAKTLADANRIIENSPTILYRLSPHPPFNLIYLSQNVRRYGYDAEKLLASPGTWMSLIESESHAQIAADIKAIVEGKAEVTLIEFRLKKPDGSHAWLEGRGYAVRDEQRQLIAIEGILTDITERKNAASELSFSYNLTTTAIENSPDAIIVVDASDRIIMFNQRFVELWNIPPEVVHAGDDAPVLRRVAARVKNEAEFLERARFLYGHPEIQDHEEIETEDGLIIERDTRSLYDAQRKYLGRIWFFRDITESRRVAERIAAMARTDALTGLANRAAFLERLALEFARAKRGGHQFAVHYLDLDRFKDVNDTLGHPVGDALLRSVAERMRGCVRETDMVARFGGDEFAVLQDDVADSSDIEILAAKIGDVIAQPYSIGGNQVQTSASIGIVPYRRDITGVDAIMMKADLALYRAKNEGRNQFRFHVAELDEQTRERMIIGEELRHAIARGEFELYYQPQVELTSGAIVGLEALIRWNHPKRGQLLPAAFIPIAETNGSILPIGEWVIEHACRQIKHWSDAGIAPPVVGVNLSGAQFKLASQLDQIVTDRLRRYHIAPDRLELELTESVLIETTQRHGEAFERLRKIGVRLAIDDFGTGYSSLDYLRMFHVSRLKIDQRFIKHAPTCADDAAIVRAAIGLAHALGIEVVAEGVETAGQRDFLIASGCHMAQGHLFGGAVPAAAATTLLRSEVQFAAI